MAISKNLRICLAIFALFSTGLPLFEILFPLAKAPLFLVSIDTKETTIRHLCVELLTFFVRLFMWNFCPTCWTKGE